MKKGSLGEVSVMKEFIRNGFEVYLPLTDNTKYDMLVHKDGVISRVECKSTDTLPNKNGEYIVQIKRVRSNKTRNVVYHFDNSEVEFLAIYISHVDSVKILVASEILVKSEIRIKP